MGGSFEKKQKITPHALYYITFSGKSQGLFAKKIKAKNDSIKGCFTLSVRLRLCTNRDEKHKETKYSTKC
jgi:hypothetical protein